MSAHTAGPWWPGCFVDPTTKCQCKSILSESYAGSIAVVSVDNGKNIADGGNDSPPLDEARANARLIAAAPTLLEALEDLLDASQPNRPDYYSEEAEDIARHKAHAAIKRATEG